jgi:elongation factor Ts
MAQITANSIKELRERIGGGGILECKKALEEADGDIEKAIDILRKAGGAKAAKKAARTAAEGTIIIKCGTDCKSAIIMEINCETDFVARDTNFLAFTDAVASCGLEKQVANIDGLLTLPYTDTSGDSTKNIAQAREALVAKIGENINIRRLQFVQSATTIGHYSHGSRIGALVKLSVDNKDLGKDIAMHIVASKPLAISPEDLPQDLLAKEKEIYLAQVRDSGKPPQIMEKMVEGKLQKFISEMTLTKQPFVKDPDTTVGALLQKAGAKVLEFVRFEVGEGIEKEQCDFASEVMAQVEGKK